MGRPKGAGTQAAGRLREAAGRGFRRSGFGGAGVDGLAREAGLTSGAFYAHFGSKAEAFRLAVTDGLDLLVQGVERFQAEHGRDWAAPFVAFYLGDRMAVDLAQACALPTFTADVARAEPAVRAAYTEALARVHAAVAGGLDGSDAQARAWALLGLLSGAAGMARAVTDPAARAAILEAAKSAAAQIVAGEGSICRSSPDPKWS